MIRDHNDSLGTLPRDFQSCVGTRRRRRFNEIVGIPKKMNADGLGMDSRLKCSGGLCLNLSPRGQQRSGNQAFTRAAPAADGCCFFFNSSRCKHSSHWRLGVSVERAVEVGKRVVTRVNIKTTVPGPSLASDNGQSFHTQHHPRWVGGGRGRGLCLSSSVRRDRVREYPGIKQRSEVTIVDKSAHWNFKRDTTWFSCIDVIVFANSFSQVH